MLKIILTLSKRRTHRAAKNTSSTYAGYGSSADESYRVGSSAADSRTNFKQKDADEQHQLDIVHGIDLAEHELEGATCHEVCACIPTDVGERLEFVSDDGESLDISV